MAQPNWRRDLARLASAAVLAQLLPLAALPWLTRMFDAAELGRWNLWAALASNLAVVACLRFEYAIVLPRTERGARAVLGLCLSLAAAWGLLLALTLAALLAAWQAFGAPASPALRAMGATLVWLPLAVSLAGLVQGLTLWLNRAGQLGLVSQGRMISAAAVSGLQVLGGVWLGGAWLGGAWLGGAWLGGAWQSTAMAQVLVGGQVLGAAAGAGWLAWRARGALAKLRGWPSRRAWRSRWLLAQRYRQFPLINAPHAFVNGLQDTLALSLVLLLAGPAEAGFFGLMVRAVMAPTSLIGGALSEVLLGRAAEQWRAGADLSEMLKKSVRMLALLALPAMVALMWGGPWMFELVFGPAWREAGEWARWLAPCMAGRMIVGPLTVLPMILQRQPTAFAFSLVGNALYVLALWAGLQGAQWLGGDVNAGLRAACAAISLVMSLYFLGYLFWLSRAVRLPRSGRELSSLQEVNQ